MFRAVRARLRVARWMSTSRPPFGAGKRYGRHGFPPLVDFPWRMMSICFLTVNSWQTDCHRSTVGRRHTNGCQVEHSMPTVNSWHTVFYMSSYLMEGLPESALWCAALLVEMRSKCMIKSV